MRPTVGFQTGLTATDDLVYVGTCIPEGDFTCEWTWAFRATDRALAYSFEDPSLRGRTSRSTATRLFGNAGVRNRWTGKELPPTTFSGPLTEHSDHLDLAVGGGIIFDNRCVEWEFHSDHVLCKTLRLEAFAETDGHALAMPAIGSGQPIVAGGRLYIWEYEPGPHVPDRLAAPAIWSSDKGANRGAWASDPPH